MAPARFSEKAVTQQQTIKLLVEQGWRHVPGKDLPRTTKNVLIESDA